MKKKIIADPLLMIATILIIVGFQAYWIRNNYDREKKLLASKAGIVFRTTVFNLQAKRLHLPLLSKDSNQHSDINIVLKNGAGDSSVFIQKTKEQVLGIADALRQQLDDSSTTKSNPKTKMVVSVNNTTLLYRNDSLKEQFTTAAQSGGGKMVQILYGIDSLQDSIKIADIVVAVQQSFAREKLNVSFAVLPAIAPSASNFTNNFPPPIVTPDDLEEPDVVTVGFAHPVIYKLQLQNTFGYLFRKILSPLLFSLFLVGVTIFTFLLLYRNLYRQRRLTEIKNEFIGNITHELKTPISTVGVAIEAMQNFNALQNPERTQEYLGIANNELQRLGLLVDKVLKLSMFEKHEVELAPETFDCKELVQEVVNSMRLQFEKYHAVVTIRNTGDSFTLLADKMHISSVVYNLLDNALKYSKADPKVDIDIAANSDTITIKIEDNGVGIPAAYKDKIFDKFFRVPSGDKHNVKGYGLGLSYVAHIVAQHQGTIEVKSAEGKGTAFTIQLPRKNEH